MAGFTNCRGRAGIGGAISEFIVVHSQNPKALCLDQTADQILASIARFASSTLPACTWPGQLCKKSMTQGTSAKRMI